MIRPYTDSDFEAVKRIWKETGWIDLSNENQVAGLGYLLVNTDPWVAELDGAAECLGIGADGIMCHNKTPLPFCGVSVITTSHVGRKQGWASRITAQLVAEGAARGNLISALGIFEQGFYDKVGFGMGSYEHIYRINPASLKLPVPYRKPARITIDDWASVHAAYVNRPARNGRCYLHPPEHIRAELNYMHKGFGLGYRDPDTNAITHFVWITEDDDSPDHYLVKFYSYNTLKEFCELLGILKSLGDQVLTIKIREPADMQLQDFLIQPISGYHRTLKAEYPEVNEASAFWQLRLNDLPGFMDEISIDADPLVFSAEITDPVSKYLSPGARWQGTSGLYEITLGATCSAKHVNQSSLPRLMSTIGAFSRMVFGVLPASSLAISDNFSAQPELLNLLDRTFSRLPKPHIEWPL